MAPAADDDGRLTVSRCHQNKDKKERQHGAHARALTHLSHTCCHTSAIPYHKTPPTRAINIPIDIHTTVPPNKHHRRLTGATGSPPAARQG